MTKPDFAQMIRDLERRTGLSNARIANRIGVPPSTLNSWKNNPSVDPLFTHGVALLDYYVEHCGREIPTV